jgi:D-arabinose 1-dehydrogenase-like Zn-dependent alcohol dehydrogenase
VLIQGHENVGIVEAIGGDGTYRDFEFRYVPAIA